MFSKNINTHRAILNSDNNIWSDLKLTKLVELQSAAGHWKRNYQLLQILDVSAKKLNSHLPKNLRTNKRKDEIWTTIVVLAYIEPLCNKFDSMSAFEKNKKWLEARDPNYQKHLIEAQKVISNAF